MDLVVCGLGRVTENELDGINYGWWWGVEEAVG